VFSVRPSLAFGSPRVLPCLLSTACRQVRRPSIYLRLIVATHIHFEHSWGNNEVCISIRHVCSGGRRCIMRGICGSVREKANWLLVIKQGTNEFNTPNWVRVKHRRASLEGRTRVREWMIGVPIKQTEKRKAKYGCGLWEIVFPRASVLDYSSKPTVSEKRKGREDNNGVESLPGLASEWICGKISMLD
jgi:hypothetical protein